MITECHKGFHLKPKAAINNTEIWSLIWKQFQFSMNTSFSIYLWSVVWQWNSLESNFSLMTWWARWLLHRTEIMTNAETVPIWFLLNLEVVQVTWNMLYMLMISYYFLLQIKTCKHVWMSKKLRFCARMEAPMNIAKSTWCLKNTKLIKHNLKLISSINNM